MFDEKLKVEVVTVATSYEEKVGIAHEVVCDLATIDDQEEDIVIQEFSMGISSSCIIVEDSLNTYEEAQEEEEKTLTTNLKEYFFNIEFKCVGKQDNIPVTITTEREDEEKYPEKYMAIFEEKEESIEITFQQWTQGMIKYFY